MTSPSYHRRVRNNGLAASRTSAQENNSPMKWFFAMVVVATVLRQILMAKRRIKFTLGEIRISGVELEIEDEREQATTAFASLQSQIAGLIQPVVGKALLGGPQIIEPPQPMVTPQRHRFASVESSRLPLRQRLATILRRQSHLYMIQSSSVTHGKGGQLRTKLSGYSGLSNRLRALSN